jgi:hypothetical protein
MKLIVAILFFVSSWTSFSQVDKVVGNYRQAIETNGNDVLEYELTLSQDGTFSFHYYSKILNRNPLEENKFGKGKWTLENNVITFFTEKEKDLDEKHTLDFTNSKARFITKSPRDKTDSRVATKITFL